MKQNMKNVTAGHPKLFLKCPDAILTRWREGGHYILAAGVFSSSELRGPPPGGSPTLPWTPPEVEKSAGMVEVGVGRFTEEKRRLGEGDGAGSGS